MKKKIHALVLTQKKKLSLSLSLPPPPLERTSGFHLWEFTGRARGGAEHTCARKAEEEGKKKIPLPPSHICKETHDRRGKRLFFLEWAEEEEEEEEEEEIVQGCSQGFSQEVRKCLYNNNKKKNEQDPKAAGDRDSTQLLFPT